MEKPKIRLKIGKKKLIALSIIAVVLAVLPWVVESTYLKHLIVMAFVYATLGMTFSMLYSTGLITLGAAAFYALGAYASATIVMKLGLSFWYAFPLVILICGILALAFGAILVRYPGVAFVVITLLFAHVVIDLAGQLEFFGGWGGIIRIPPPTPIGPIVFVEKITFYYLILALFLLIALIFYALYSSRIGRAWRAIKLSPKLAETLGINLYRYRLLAFIVASLAAAAVGSFYAHYFQVITPLSFGGWFSINIQLFSVLGGLEFYILGPALGAVIMTFVPEFLRVTKEVEPIITGILLLVIILFFTGGILGSIKKLPSFSRKSISDRIKKLIKMSGLTKTKY